MYNFFVDSNDRTGNKFYITGSDFNHIKNVLRMKKGENFLVSCDGNSSLCKIDELTQDTVVALILEENFQSTDLPIKIYLFQGLPKSDKMELIVQKAVELGVHAIIPTQMQRCVVKLDDKKKKSKTSRWQSISESAAKQSKRSIIPKIHNIITFKQAVEFAGDLDLIIVPYESKRRMEDTRSALSMIKSGMSVGIFIGPEGGFEDNEIDLIIKNGARTVSLGQRILRTETAAITAVGMCMLYTEMNINGDE